jgi:hypothetical protein
VVQIQNIYGAVIFTEEAADNLRGADLRGADLRDADLRDADLRDADLRGANLWGADLWDADLRDADLRDADLRGANLWGADLWGANLRGANLWGAKNIPEKAIAETRILPEGSLIGWKKCRGGVIVKLRIPEEAKRSNAFGRKCRAEFVDVLEIFGAPKAISNHDGETQYTVGARIYPDAFCEDWTQECASGIHFFITRLEAEEY